MPIQAVLNQAYAKHILILHRVEQPKKRMWRRRKGCDGLDTTLRRLKGEYDSLRFSDTWLISQGVNFHVHCRSCQGHEMLNDSLGI